MFDEKRLLDAPAKHGFPAAPLELAGLQGVANETWLCGDVVVRVSKNPDYLSDSFTESVAVPAVVAAGIKTPKLLIFDEDVDVLPAVFSIYERIPGLPLSRVTFLPDPYEFFFELGREIRRLHESVTEVPDPKGYLDDAWEVDLEGMENSWPHIFPDSAVPAELKHLPSPPELRFCHQDLHPDNILVHEGKLSAILDWGDAGWANPAVDFRYIPTQNLEATLEGYGELSATVRQMVLIHQIDQLGYALREGKDYGRYGNTEPASLKAMLFSP